MEELMVKIENSIKELKAKLVAQGANTTSTIGSELDKLELKSTELKTKLDKWIAAGKQKEEDFKKEFKQDAEQLSQALKNLFIKNI